MMEVIGAFLLVVIIALAGVAAKGTDIKRRILAERELREYKDNQAGVRINALEVVWKKQKEIETVECEMCGCLLNKETAIRGPGEIRDRWVSLEGCLGAEARDEFIYHPWYCKVHAPSCDEGGKANYPKTTPDYVKCDKCGGKVSTRDAVSGKKEIRTRHNCDQIPSFMEDYMYTPHYHKQCAPKSPKNKEKI